MICFSEFFSTTEYPLFVYLAANLQGTTFLSFVLMGLILLSFTIAGAEVALFSLSNKDIDMLKTKQHVEAKRIIKLLEEPKEVYATLLIVGTFINICIILFSNFLMNQFFSFEKMNFLVEMVLKVIIIAFIIVFFGKIFPKVWASQHNVRFAYTVSFVIETLHTFFRGISKWIVSLADGIGRSVEKAGLQTADAGDLDKAIDNKSEEEASLEEKRMMKGIVKFGNITIKQIMRNRVDVSGIEHNSSFGDLIKSVEELHYSRLPVYKNSMDEVTGIINTKDIIPYINEEVNYQWHYLMRAPYFVPETKLIEDLLKEFQQKRIHFAVVVDEFGGTSGIVTMEDILEEIIGEIKDEFDEEESGNRKIDENNYVFEGKTMIHDMCRSMQLPIDTFDKIRGESDSLAGLVLELAGEFPAVNAVVSSGDFEFTILQSETNRIQLAKVTIKPKIIIEND